MPIAIVGLGALFPGSATPLAFWRDILEGRDRLTDVPRTHWLREDYYDPTRGTPDKVYATRGGFLPEIDFSPMEYGMPPSTMPSTDTAQLLSLVVAKHALLEATRGKFESVDRSRMSVMLGVASATELVGTMCGRLQRPVVEHAMRTAGLRPDEIARVSKVLDGCYVPWQESTFPGLLGNVVAGRVTNRLDLGGTNVVVDAACAGSLAAISMAVNDLTLGNSDLVLSGGVDALNDILMYMCFAQTGALSPSSDCRPFSDQSDGTMIGEGVGVLALRRLADAERDGDAIYAVIRGIGSSSDGKAKSIYAPSAAGQTLALRRAYSHAGYGAQTVELVEGHGTGTVAGDAAEVEALRIVFEEAGAARQRCALGSVKAQIGHTKASAGAAGMIKTVLALHHKVLPPTIKVRAPNAKLHLDESPFYLNTETRPWVHTAQYPRRASVSALGFGGTNFHVALEEYVGPSEHPARFHTSPSELLLLTAESPTALAVACRAAANHCSAAGALVHLAKTQQLAFDARAHARLALVATDEADAREKLSSAAESIEKSGDTAFSSPRGIYYAVGETDTLASKGSVAVLFPGQGSQYVGMGNDLAVHFACVRELWDRAAATVHTGDETLADRVYPRPVFGDEAHAQLERQLTATEWAQPAIAATSLGMWRLLELTGLEPTHVGGHSLGEITAGVAARIFDEQTALTVARRRGELMASASDGASGGVPGAMTAVAADLATVQRTIEGIDVVLANHNSPRQVVLSGAVTAIERAEQKLEAAKLTVRRLPVSTAFHSPLVSGAVAPFRAFLDTVAVAPAGRAYYANASAALYPNDARAVREQLAASVASPVRFVEEIEAMYAAGARTFIEVGPDAVLSKLTERCLEGRPHLALSLDQRGKHGITALQSALGRLCVAGHALSFARFWEGQTLPEDLAAKPPAKFSIKLCGANYGKPYPPKEPAVYPTPAPRPYAAAQAAPPDARAATPGPNAPVSIATAPVAPSPTMPADTIPATDPSAWVESLRQLQAPAIAAQLEFQRLMADSHMAFLRAVETSYASLTPSASFAHAAPAKHLVTPTAPAPAPWGIPAAQSPHPAAPPHAASTARAATSSDSALLPPLPVTSTRTPAPTPVATAPAPAALAVDLTAIMLAIVAEKTGYPAEMIDPGMDLEADLGIDSIKRVEILSAMRQRVPNLPQVNTAKMATMRTLAQIIALVGPIPSSGPVVSPDTKVAVVASVPAPLSARSAEVKGSVSAPSTTPSLDLTPILLAIVAEKTGYPAEMIDTGMDLEADLGIDSIKRVEILSAMRQRVPNLPQVNTAKMATMRTLAQIIALFDGTAAAPSVALPAPHATTAPCAAASPSPVLRLAVRALPAPAAGFSVPGLHAQGRIAITPDGGGVAAALAERLRARGIDAKVTETVPTDAVGVLFLGGLRPVSGEAAIAVNREAFAAARAVAARFRDAGGLFITVQDTGGDFGLSGSNAEHAWLAGLAALAKTAGEEWPKATAKAIDLERGGRDDAALADALLRELFAGGPEVEVGLRADGSRIAIASVPTPLPSAATRKIEAGAVFVVTGGARGVTAASLIELARAAQPRVLILGRTTLEEEPAAFRGVSDEASLKRVALEEARRTGTPVTPKDIGATVEKLLAGREVRHTLAQLTAAGSEARYAAADVRDPAAVGALLDEVRRAWGPIRGVVHGAGVLADALLDKKTDAHFDRVFDTKVLGLRALLAATLHDPLEWLCLFSSVAARAGNAGQVDYAMANEILNKVGAVEAVRRAGACRVVSIGWGPWDGGMVTPALRDHFIARGVALLPVAAGAAAFVRELCAEPSDDLEIVIGGGAAGLQGGTAPRLRAEVLVSAATHPQLVSHRIQGKTVLPMVLPLEWFARLSRAMFPERSSVQLRDVRVVRGVPLVHFEGAGDRFTISSDTGDGGTVALELRDANGAVRYAATVAPAESHATAESLNGHELAPSPWSPTEIYASDKLFHGEHFQVIRTIEGISTHGARATLAATADAGWPTEAWETDLAAVDGALQLAILCGLRSLGPTLPLRIGKIGYSGVPTAGPIQCALLVRSQTPERVVCDIALASAAGVPVADLVDVEMYAVPTGTTAN